MAVWSEVNGRSEMAGEFQRLKSASTNLGVIQSMSKWVVETKMREFSIVSV